MRLARWCLLVSLTLHWGTTVAQDAVQQRLFSVPGHGALSLDLPSSWRAASKSLEQPPSVVLRIGARGSDGFNLQVTALWLDETKRAGFADAPLKARVQATAIGQLGKAEETQASLQEIRGSNVSGYYYSLTSKGPLRGPGDYKYLTQGTLLVGELVVVFTLLQRDAAPSEREQVLRSFAGASFAKTSAPPITASADGFRFDMPDPRLRITIPDIPQFALGVHPNAPSQPSARFFGGGPNGYSLSILIPTADAGMTALDCAGSLSRSIASRYKLDPKFTVTHRSNDVTFLMLFPYRAGPIIQLKAYLLSGIADHCLEVHVSKVVTAAKPEAAAGELSVWLRGFRNARVDSY